LSLQVLLHSILGITFFQLGRLCFFGREASSVKRINVTFDWNKNTFLIFSVFISLISIVAALYIYNKIGVPVLSTNIHNVRVEGFSKVSHYSLFLLRNIGIIFHYVFIFYFTNKNKLDESRFIIYLFFSVSFLLMISTAGRADLFFILVPLFINYHYLVSEIKIFKAVNIFIILVVGIVLYNFLRMFQSGGEHETLLFLSDFVGNNVFLMFGFHLVAQFSLVAICYHDVLLHVPASLPFFHGSLIPQTLSTYLPGHQSPPGEMLKEAAGLTFVGGQSNLTLLGDFYSDFGWLGIAAGMFLVGLVLEAAYLCFCKKKSATFLILYVYILYSLIVGLPGGMFSQAIRYYYLFIILISCFIMKKVRV